MKREIPLFIIDVSRSHKLGDCDFITCTDKENGFVAKVSYVEARKSEVGDTFRIEPNNTGYAARFEIVRMLGSKQDTSAMRTLLKKATMYFFENIHSTVSADGTSVGEMISFLDILIRGNKFNADDPNLSLQQRKTTLKGINMLERIKQQLMKNKN